eukprot:GHVQ01015900.1.p1 GENE.GHVQ01015900.1~~GHVQ01015900.1.p1  ORF type:complete len:717 (+),score=113.20 GHVQ01015900.1:166-2316(+)
MVVFSREDIRGWLSRCSCQYQSLLDPLELIYTSSTINSSRVLLSVILPVFNAESFLPCTLLSLSSQTILRVPCSLLSCLVHLSRKTKSTVNHNNCCCSDTHSSTTTANDLSNSFSDSSCTGEVELGFEIIAVDDGSTDGSVELLREYAPKLEYAGWRVVIAQRTTSMQTLSISDSSSRLCHPPLVSSSSTVCGISTAYHPSPSSTCHASSPRGPGACRNAAVRQSEGEFIAFCDADDVFHHHRFLAQFCAQIRLNIIQTSKNKNLTTTNQQVDTTKIGCEIFENDSSLSTAGDVMAIIGSQLNRDPPGSTPRYVEWLNGITGDQLITSRFRESTVAMPSWWMHREIFYKVGGFVEGVGVPEDLIFLYRHVRPRPPLPNSHHSTSCLRGSLSSSAPSLHPTAHGGRVCEIDLRRGDVGGDAHGKVRHKGVISLGYEEARFMVMFLMCPESSDILPFIISYLPTNTASSSIDMVSASLWDVISYSSCLRLARVNIPLVTYRYHPQCLSLTSVDRRTLFHLRLYEITQCVLKDWGGGIGIWNAGKAGRQFFLALPTSLQLQVQSFYDVDKKKICSHRFIVHHYPPNLRKSEWTSHDRKENNSRESSIEVDRSDQRNRTASHRKVPILHWSAAIKKPNSVEGRSVHGHHAVTGSSVSCTTIGHKEGRWHDAAMIAGGDKKGREMLVTCVKYKLMDGDLATFEKYLDVARLIEGVDFYFFS